MVGLLFVMSFAWMWLVESNSREETTPSFNKERALVN